MGVIVVIIKLHDSSFYLDGLILDMELKPFFLRLPCSRLSLSYLHEVYFVGTRENTNLVLRSHIDILPALLFATILGFAFG